MCNTEGIDNDVELAYLKQRGLEDYQVVRITSEDDEELYSEAEDADAVVIVYLQANEYFFSRLKKCKVLMTQCIGVNNIDLEAATKHKVYVGNVPDYCVEEVAIHTVSMMLACARKLYAFDRNVKNGEWNPHSAGKIRRISKKVYGLAAFGNISRKIVELMRPFGVEFVAYDLNVLDEVFEQYGVRRVGTLEALFEESDYLSVHIPLLENTKHLIDAKVLKHAKPDMILVATGRGGVIDEIALKDKIIDGTIQSVGIDVIEDEGGEQSPLFGMDQVIMSPHVAYYSEEAIIECREKVIMQIVEVLEEQKAPTYLVNKEMSFEELLPSLSDGDSLK